MEQPSTIRSQFFERVQAMTPREGKQDTCLWGTCQTTRRDEPNRFGHGLCNRHYKKARRMVNAMKVEHPDTTLEFIWQEFLEVAPQAPPGT